LRYCENTAVSVCSLMCVVTRRGLVVVDRRFGTAYRKTLEDGTNKLS